MKQTHGATQALLSWQRLGATDISVMQDQQHRYLLFNHQRQSQMLLAEPARVSYPHNQFLLRTIMQRSRQGIFLRTVLQLGLGGGELNRALLSQFTAIELVSVELWPEVIALYQQFFRLPGKPAEQLICAEALSFCRQAVQQQQHYSLILIDLYPWPDDWAALLNNTWQLLSENGLLMVNVTMPALFPAVAEQLHQLAGRSQHFQATGYLNQLVLVEKPA